MTEQNYQTAPTDPQSKEKAQEEEDRIWWKNEMGSSNERTCHNPSKDWRNMSKVLVCMLEAIQWTPAIAMNNFTAVLGLECNTKLSIWNTIVPMSFLSLSPQNWREAILFMFFFFFKSYNLPFSIDFFFFLGEKKKKKLPFVSFWDVGYTSIVGGVAICPSQVPLTEGAFGRVIKQFIFNF